MGWLTTVLILLPDRGALVVWLLPLPRYCGRLARAARRARRGRPLDQRASSASTSSGGLAVRAAARLVRATSASRTTSGCYGFSLWLVGLTVVVMARRDRVRVLGGPRPRRAPTSG